jgi:hypothetical protein
MSLPLRDRDAIALPIILLALVFGYGALVAPQSPMSGRPVLSSRVLPPDSLSQHVPARLWQDPILAADEAAKQPVENSKSTLPSSRLAGQRLAASLPAGTLNLGDAALDLRIVLVTVPGGRYHEDSEQRLRARYSVVQAVLSSDYTPINPDRIGAFQLSANSKPVALEAYIYKAPSPSPRPMPLVTAPDSAPSVMKPAVVLLYVTDDLLERACARSLGRDLDAFADGVLCKASDTTTGKLCVELRAIGPITSDDLLNLPEIGVTSSANLLWRVGPDPSLADDNPPVRNVIWESPFATLSPSRVPASQPAVLRRVAPDNRLAQLLDHELRLRVRGFRSTQDSDRVLLIYERDSSYGRAIEEELRTQLERSHPKHPFRVAHSIGYLRGIDGFKESASKRETPKPKEKLEGPETLEVGQARGVFVADAAGEQQGDYLARTAQYIHTLEAEGGQPFTAIGILGTDFYDKSLILQVLKPSFPNALFFTTDLDARMLEPSVYPYFRNLIVASSYGLSLSKDLQPSVGPFRDSYQTALYLTTLLILGEPNAVKFWNSILPPGTAADSDRASLLGDVYEIGKSGPWRLAMPCERVYFGARPTDPFRLGTRLDSSARVLPTVLVISIILALVAFAWMWSHASNPTKRPNLSPGVADVPPEPPRRWVRECILRWLGLWAGVAITALLIGYLPALIARAGWVSEPASGTSPDGVNAWPTIAVTLVVGILVLLYAILNLISFSRGVEHLIDQAHLEPVDGKSSPSSPWSIAGWKPAQPQDVGSWWPEFLELADPKRAGLRVLVFVALYIVMGLLAWWCLFPTTGGSLRGYPAFVFFNVAYFIAALAIAILVFQIWDATRLCESAIRWLNCGKTEYPDRAHGDIPSDFNVDKKVAACWLDVHIAGSLTSKVSRALPLPFMAILAVLAARSVAIDDWRPNPALYLTCFILGATLVLATAQLQHAARRLRNNELERLSKFMAQAPEDRRGPIGIVKAEIENYRRGAFASWTQNPIVGALLTAAGALAISILNGVLT